MNILLSPYLLSFLGFVLSVFILIVAIDTRNRSLATSLFGSFIFGVFYLYLGISGINSEESRVIARQVFVFIMALLIGDLFPDVYKAVKNWRGHGFKRIQ